MKHLLSPATLLFVTAALAHPVPDIPVRTWLTTDGGCTVTVEVDPRCFEPDPNTAASLMQPILPTLSAERRAELMTKAAALVKKYVVFEFDPTGPVQPEFTFEFTGHDRAPLVREEDIVVLTGTWTTRAPAGSAAWRIQATKETPLAIVFRNYFEGREQPQFSVLFPGETSFAFKFDKPTAPPPQK